MYNQIFEHHSELLKAMSHPKRLEIMHLLRDRELSVTEIHTMLDLPQANISQHLMILRSAGVLKTKKSGKQILYRISHPNFIKVSDLMREFLVEYHSGSILGEIFNVDTSELLPLTHDPVCQMRLSPKTAGFAHKYKKHDYYFCASGCLKLFKESPKKYVKK